LSILISSILVCIPAGRSQSTGNGNGGTGGTGTGSSMGRGGFGRPSMGPADNDDPFDSAMTERRLRALNSERQKQMVADTNKLLKLAKELNEEVASANEESFTPEQLRKIAEIEKLARNVRERMTTAVGQTPSLATPTTLGYPVH
jgi:hypothetical protein